MATLVSDRSFEAGAVKALGLPNTVTKFAIYMEHGSVARCECEFLLTNEMIVALKREWSKEASEWSKEAPENPRLSRLLDGD